MGDHNVAHGAASGWVGHGQVPALDGFRAIAIAIVVIAHFGLGSIVPGGFGVTLFFFISGMLITRLLASEFEEHGRISLGRFWMRRALRLYPALLVMVAMSCAVLWSAGAHVRLGDLCAALFYYVNYWGWYVGLDALHPNQALTDFHPFGVLWSLAVEEHFYVLWPPIVALTWRWRTLSLWMLIAGCVGVLGWRCWFVLQMGADQTRVYGGTDTRFDSILYGCLATRLLHGPQADRYLAAVRHPGAWLVAGGLLACSLLIRDPDFRSTFRYTLQGLAMGIIVPALCAPGAARWQRRLTSALSMPVMQMIGRLSYSLYLQHWVAYVLALTVAPLHSFRWYAVAIPCALLFTWLSYRLVERPMLALRRRWGSHAG